MAKPLTNIARTLRKNMTDAERLLWRHLRNKQLNGLRFRRQQPIGSYIVDFVCFEKHLIIEADGGQHANSSTDVQRDRWLEKMKGSLCFASGTMKYYKTRKA